jgi:hypothetical protein
MSGTGVAITLWGIAVFICGIWAWDRRNASTPRIYCQLYETRDYDPAFDIACGCATAGQCKHCPAEDRPAFTTRDGMLP